MGIDWSNMLLPDTSPLEIFIRGTVTYLFVFGLIRFLRRRQAGTVSTTDLLAVVFIADAAQNGMASDYTSLPDGLLLVSTIVGWSFALDWLGFHVPGLERFVHPQPLSLVQNGRLQRENMRRELITFGELMTSLREQGVEDISRVKIARIEGDGQITVIPFEEEPGRTPKRDHRAP